MQVADVEGAYGVLPKFRPVYAQGDIFRHKINEW
jgi:hypothetical protein